MTCVVRIEIHHNEGIISAKEHQILAVVIRSVFVVGAENARIGIRRRGVFLGTRS